MFLVDVLLSVRWMHERRARIVRYGSLPGSVVVHWRRPVKLLHRVAMVHHLLALHCLMSVPLLIEVMLLLIVQVCRWAHLYTWLAGEHLLLCGRHHGCMMRRRVHQVLRPKVLPIRVLIEAHMIVIGHWQELVPEDRQRCRCRELLGPVWRHWKRVGRYALQRLRSALLVRVVVVVVVMVSLVLVVMMLLLRLRHSELHVFACITGGLAHRLARYRMREASGLVGSNLCGRLLLSIGRPSGCALSGWTGGGWHRRGRMSLLRTSHL